MEADIKRNRHDSQSSSLNQGLKQILPFQGGQFASTLDFDDSSPIQDRIQNIESAMNQSKFDGKSIAHGRNMEVISQRGSYLSRRGGDVGTLGSRVSKMYRSIEVPSISNYKSSIQDRRNLGVNPKGSPRLPRQYKKKNKDPFSAEKSPIKPMNRIEEMQDINVDLYRPENQHLLRRQGRNLDEDGFIISAGNFGPSPNIAPITKLNQQHQQMSVNMAPSMALMRSFEARDRPY